MSALLIGPEQGSPGVPRRSEFANLKVAVVHEWFTTFAGSERVVEQLIRMFPNSDLFALVDHLPDRDRAFLAGKHVHTSFLQNLPFSKKHFRKLLFLLPSAVESLDVSQYDVVLSSSHSVAKGILTGPDQLHLCYCHSPIRYAWDQQHEYLAQANLTRGLGSLYARLMLHYLRLWDVRTAHGVDHFMANSNFVARRITKVYRRKSSVVYPPVNTESFRLETQKEDYYLAAARFVPYKRLDVIVKAFTQMPSKRLVICGDGEMLPACKRIAGSNIEFLGFQPDTALRGLMRKARAFVFAAEEDFGITAVEAQACGTPVICYGGGGVLDTVVPGRTGVFFDERTPESLIEAVREFERIEQQLDPFEIRRNAERFSETEFQRRFLEVFEEQWRLARSWQHIAHPLAPAAIAAAVGR